MTSNLTSAPDVLNASILIVDDQESNVALLEELLTGAGYSNVTSRRGLPGFGSSAIFVLI